VTPKPVRLGDAARLDGRAIALSHEPERARIRRQPASAVETVSPSNSACATSIRWNGSRCGGGSVDVATACGAMHGTGR
jgi:hypothetical protein